MNEINCRTKVYIGIDPGSVESAVGILDDKGRYVEHYRLSKWTPDEYLLLLTELKERFDIQLVYLELVHSMPKQGVVSVASFMKATGVIYGILLALEIPFVEKVPQKWRSLDPELKTKKDETETQKKKKSLNYIQKRYPQAKLTKTIEHNAADALCMAEWIYLEYK